MDEPFEIEFQDINRCPACRCKSRHVRIFLNSNESSQLDEMLLFIVHTGFP